jgi:hypothetical protein
LWVASDHGRDASISETLSTFGNIGREVAIITFCDFDLLHGWPSIIQARLIFASPLVAAAWGHVPHSFHVRVIVRVELHGVFDGFLLRREYEGRSYRPFTPDCVTAVLCLFDEIMSLVGHECRS